MGTIECIEIFVNNIMNEIVICILQGSDSDDDDSHSKKKRQRSESRSASEHSSSAESGKHFF